MHSTNQHARIVRRGINGEGCVSPPADWVDNSNNESAVQQKRSQALQIVRSNLALYVSVVLAAFAAMLVTQIGFAAILVQTRAPSELNTFWNNAGFAHPGQAMFTLARIFSIAAFALLPFVLWERLAGATWWQKALWVWLLLVLLNASMFRTFGSTLASIFYVSSGRFIQSDFLWESAIRLARNSLSLFFIALISSYGAHIAYTKTPKRTEGTEAKRTTSPKTTAPRLEKLLLGLPPSRYRALLITIVVACIAATVLPLAFSGIAGALLENVAVSSHWVRFSSPGSTYWTSIVFNLVTVATYALLVFVVWDRLPGSSSIKGFLQRTLTVFFVALLMHHYIGILLNDLVELAVYGSGYTANFFFTAQTTGYVLTIIVPITIGAHMASSRRAMSPQTEIS